MIPTSAIDHIEVLRDGAAAQYGSDAIAGIINIILKDDTQGAELIGSAGQNMDRADGVLYTGLGHMGFNLYDKGFVDISLSSKVQLASNRANPIASTILLYNLVNGAPDPREATINRLVTNNYGTMPQRSIDFSYNAGYDAGNGIELYSFGTLSHRITDLLGSFRAPNNSASLPEIHPNGFYPRTLISEIDFETALGARGKIDGWDWDVSSTYGGDSAGENVDHTLNPSLGPTSPTHFYVGTLASSEWVNSIDLTKSFDIDGGHF